MLAMFKKSLLSCILAMCIVKSYSQDTLRYSVELFFDYDSSTLKEIEAEKLSSCLDTLVIGKIFAIHINSFASNEGDSLYNNQLAEDRGTSVAEWLYNHYPVFPRDIHSHVFGETRLKYHGKDSYKNRRVQVHIIYLRFKVPKPTQNYFEDTTDCNRDTLVMPNRFYGIMYKTNRCHYLKNIKCFNYGTKLTNRTRQKFSDMIIDSLEDYDYNFFEELNVCPDMCNNEYVEYFIPIPQRYSGYNLVTLQNHKGKWEPVDIPHDIDSTVSDYYRYGEKFMRIRITCQTLVKVYFDIIPCGGLFEGVGIMKYKIRRNYKIISVENSTKSEFDFRFYFEDRRDFSPTQKAYGCIYNKAGSDVTPMLTDYIMIRYIDVHDTSVVDTIKGFIHDLEKLGVLNFNRRVPYYQEEKRCKRCVIDDSLKHFKGLRTAYFFGSLKRQLKSRNQREDIYESDYKFKVIINPRRYKKHLKKQ